MDTVTNTTTALTRITLYGCLADAGGRTLALAVPAAGVSGAALRQLVAAACPAIAEQVLSARVRLCVDDVIMPDPMFNGPTTNAAATIAATARIALFPPVSGG
jgi:molybdopterin converting factor small subunit